MDLDGLNHDTEVLNQLAGIIVYLLNFLELQHAQYPQAKEALLLVQADVVTLAQAIDVAMECLELELDFIASPNDYPNDYQI